MHNRMLSKPLEQGEIVPGPPLVPVHLEIATGRVVPQIVHNVKKKNTPTENDAGYGFSSAGDMHSDRTGLWKDVGIGSLVE